VEEQWVLFKDPHDEWWASLLESCQEVRVHAISNMAHDIKYDSLHVWTILNINMKILNPLLPSLNI